MNIDDKEQVEMDINNMLEDCCDWDSETTALTEAFKRGMETQKRIINNTVKISLSKKDFEDFKCLILLGCELNKKEKKSVENAKKILIESK